MTLNALRTDAMGVAKGGGAEIDVRLVSDHHPPWPPLCRERPTFWEGQVAWGEEVASLCFGKSHMMCEAFYCRHTRRPRRRW